MQTAQIPQAIKNKASKKIKKAGLKAARIIVALKPIAKTPQNKYVAFLMLITPFLVENIILVCCMQAIKGSILCVKNSVVVRTNGVVLFVSTTERIVNT